MADCPVITREAHNSGVGNLSTIEKNIPGNGAPRRKLVIENLHVRDGKVGLGKTLLGGGPAG